MYAVIETGGKQYKVEKGMQLDVEKLSQEVGEKVVFDQVKLIGGEVFMLGSPNVEKCTVEAEVVEHFRDDKVMVIKFQRRQDNRSTQGHRQSLTRIKIIGIKGAVKKKAKAAKKEVEEVVDGS